MRGCFDEESACEIRGFSSAYTIKPQRRLRFIDSMKHQRGVVIVDEHKTTKELTSM